MGQNLKTGKQRLISRWRENIRCFFGKGVYPSMLSFWLNFPLRKFILSPKKLADRLHLKEKF